MENGYFTVARETAVEIKVERSRFIAFAREVKDEEEARNFISRIQGEHRQATHICFAYRIGQGKGEKVYYSDAGEPSGTAGRPILGAICSLGLTNVVVVVTRYFGGKKLGIRGLIKAYGTAARRALEEGGRVQRLPTREVEFHCDYAELNRLLHHIRSHGGEVLEAVYGEKVYLRAALPLQTLPFPET